MYFFHLSKVVKKNAGTLYAKLKALRKSHILFNATITLVKAMHQLNIIIYSLVQLHSICLKLVSPSLLFPELDLLSFFLTAQFIEVHVHKYLL